METDHKNLTLSEMKIYYIKSARMTASYALDGKIHINHSEGEYYDNNQKTYRSRERPFLYTPFTIEELAQFEIPGPEEMGTDAWEYDPEGLVGANPYSESTFTVHTSTLTLEIKDCLLITHIKDPQTPTVRGFFGIAPADPKNGESYKNVSTLPGMYLHNGEDTTP